MEISCGDVDAVQGAHEQMGFRAAEAQNQIAKPILRLIHWKENNRPAGNIGEKLLKNDFRRAGGYQAIRFLSGKNAK